MLLPIKWRIIVAVSHYFFLNYFLAVVQVFYSCPHFGSKLADMPWRMGLVFRPAPTVSINNP